jgi:O-antigen/teichoic acid export membrane protein
LRPCFAPRREREERLVQLSDFWHSPALRVTAAFCVAGLGFAAGNILLAYELPPSEYALVALIIALLQVGAAVSSMGMDGVVNRREVALTGAVLRRVLTTSVVVAAGMVVFSRLAYGLDAALLTVVFLGTLGGGANTVAAAKYQSMQQFGGSILLTQSQNYVLAFAGLLTLALGITHAAFPGFLVALGYFLSAAIGWMRLYQREESGRRQTFEMAEAIAYVGVSVAGLVLVQLERLIVPSILTMDDLATYGVLAALAGSPFRMLQMGVGYTLLPRLRAAADPRTRRRLLARETGVTALACLGASAAIWFLAPFLVELFLHGKYVLRPSLVTAAIVMGLFKVASALTSSATVALGTTRQLGYLNLMAWVSVAGALTAAVAGARWGLEGVLYGVGVGWFIRTIAAGILAAPHLVPGSRIARLAP